MLTNDEKIEMIQSKIKQLGYNTRDNLIQIEQISLLDPIDYETINAIESHIADNEVKINALNNALGEIHENIV